MIGILLLLCVILAILLGGGYYAYRIAFYSPLKNRDQVPSPHDPQYDPYRPEIKRIYHQLKERSYETVTVQSYDGLTLSGRYYHVQDGAPLDLCFHGYRSHPLTDFSGGSELSFQLQHNLLLVDQRAHGTSEGRTITFGIQERLDVLSWVYYARSRFGSECRILLYGVSMGAATVLMASELELPENVKGIVADCPYASPMDIILDVAKKKDMPIPHWLIKPFVILGAKIFGGFDIRETDAIRAVERASIPILIIHGEDDRYVPCEMSDIAAHNPQYITRHTFPGAAHGISYLVDKARYQKIVTEFVNQVLT